MRLAATLVEVVGGVVAVRWELVGAVEVDGVEVAWRVAGRWAVAAWAAEGLAAAEAVEAIDSNMGAEAMEAIATAKAQ